MLTMILADDEPIITRGIQKLVDWEALGITIIGAYDTGNSAMEAILSRAPDMALLDISMPGMDGIEILKSIRSLGLPTRVVFISGFQNFEYARSAITYGAVDYLLKPVIREELLRAVEKAVGQLLGNKERETLEEGRKEEGLKSPAAGESGTDGEEQESRKTDGAANPLEETTYLPVLAEVLFEGGEGEQEQRLIRFSFLSFLEEYLAEHQLGILFTRKSHIIMVLKGVGAEQAKEVLSRLWEQACETTGKRTAFAAGNVVERMSAIPAEYEKCLELGRYFFFANEIRIPVLTVGEDVFSQKAQVEDLNGARKEMIEALLAQDQTLFRSAYARFARILCLVSEGRKEDACYYFCSTVRLVEESVQEMHLEGRNPDMKELLEKGRQCENFGQMKALFLECLESYAALFRATMESNEKKDIARAKAYIESHYGENLTLEVLAGEIHMNPYYFSSYFKKNAGENFKDYVNRVRIRHAVSLLISTDRKVYEIAAEVGFRDVRSFTEVFSRTYGETPHSYRKRVLQQEGN